MQRIYQQFLSKFKLNISEKCVATPSFLFLVLIALAKICFFHVVLLKPHENIVLIFITKND